MREILFRGKRADSGEWVEGGYKHEKVGNYLTAVFIVQALTSGVWENHRVDPSTVGQFTGLRDKNGKRIFEGDVLCVIGQGIFKCRWDDGNFEFCLSNRKESFGLAYVSPNDIFVIGNKWDNPELLEGEG